MSVYFFVGHTGFEPMKLFFIDVSKPIGWVHLHF